MNNNNNNNPIHNQEKTNEEKYDNNNNSEELDNFDDLLDDDYPGFNRSYQRESMKSSVVDLLIHKNSNPKNKNLKNLYQNIGSRVSKYREINDTFNTKLSEQKQTLFVYEERLQERLKFLEELREAKAKKQTKFFNEKYKESLSKNTIELKIHTNHIKFDSEIIKIHEESEKEISNLKNKLNSLVDNSNEIKSNIDEYRKENNKLEITLADIIERKETRAKEMEIISNQANAYLNNKDEVNKNIGEINLKIEEQKENHEANIFEINQMIDNTKKIKQFQENFAVEKFSKNSNKKNISYYDPNSKSNNNDLNNTAKSQDSSHNIINEEQNRLDYLNTELKKKKVFNAYLNFSKLIYLKKQKNMPNLIDEVREKTGSENLDKLSEYLAMSTKTNKLFECDLKKLNEDKILIEKDIEEIKVKLENSKCLLDDTSSKKFVYIEKLKNMIATEEKINITLNKKLYNMNRVVDVIAIGLKNVCSKIDYFDGNLGSYGEVNIL